MWTYFDGQSKTRDAPADFIDIRADALPFNSFILLCPDVSGYQQLRKKSKTYQISEFKTRLSSPVRG